jgi:hypothetical protein
VAPPDDSNPKRPNKGFEMDEATLTKGRPGAKPVHRYAPPTARAPAPAAPPKAAAPAPQQPKPPPRPFQRPIVPHVNAQGLVVAGAPDSHTAVQRKMSRSRFENRASYDQLLGVPPSPSADDDDDDDESTVISKQFDGSKPAPELTSKDIWRALNPPMQSREGKRSCDAYEQVINQFAVGSNPRYEPDAPDKPRAHIFVWDVTKAMNAEIPHFVGPKEMSLGQTVDWVRMEGPMRGWRKVSLIEALEQAQQGFPVVAVPKDPRTKMIAMVRPAPPGPNGQPRFATAGKARANDLGLLEALGVFAAEYFAHA